MLTLTATVPELQPKNPGDTLASVREWLPHAPNLTLAVAKPPLQHQETQTACISHRQHHAPHLFLVPLQQVALKTQLCSPVA